jgi:outer membrane protein assembly factor BamA
MGEGALYYFYKSQDIYVGSTLSSNFHYLTKGVRLGTKLDIEPLGRISSGIEFNDVTYEKIFSLLPEEKITRLFVRTRIDFLDAPIFPSSGMALNLDYSQGIAGLGGNYDFSKAKIDLEGYLPLPRRQVVFLKGKVYLGKGNVPFSERYRLGGADNLIGFGRDQFIGKDLLQLRLGYRLPLTIPAAGLVEGVYLLLLQDYGVVALNFNDLSKNEINSGFGAELQFNTLLGLAARMNLGYGQGVNFFFSIGNEF